MKVLSIKEPFASLIANNIKRYETRSWKTKYRGEIYIHASMTKNKMDDRINELMKMINPNPGYILCKGILKDCILIDENFVNSLSDLEKKCGNFDIGRYAWLIENIEVIRPVKTKGKLGIWNYENKE